jgi:hypothetical protein
VGMSFAATGILFDTSLSPAHPPAGERVGRRRLNSDRAGFIIAQFRVWNQTEA